MTRQVALSEEAYKTLSRMKGRKMSFSGVILKLVDASRQKRNFLRFAGTLKAQSEDLEQFKRQIESDRLRNTERSD
jgi:predicted CopG family antitoxin